MMLQGKPDQSLNFVETSDASQGKYKGKAIEQQKVLPWHN